MIRRFFPEISCYLFCGLSCSEYLAGMSFKRASSWPAYWTLCEMESRHATYLFLFFATSMILSDDYGAWAWKVTRWPWLSSFLRPHEENSGLAILLMSCRLCTGTLADKRSCLLFYDWWYCCGVGRLYNLELRYSVCQQSPPLTSYQLNSSATQPSFFQCSLCCHWA